MHLTSEWRTRYRRSLSEYWLVCISTSASAYRTVRRLCRVATPLGRCVGSGGKREGFLTRLKYLLVKCCVLAYDVQ